MGVMKPFLVDTTFRDGLQSPGLTLEPPMVRRITEGLDEGGILELEAGIPASGPESIAFIRSLRDESKRIICWCRAREDDIQLSEQAGTGAVHIAFPISRCHMRTMAWNPDLLRRRIPALLRLARRSHDFVSVGLMDCFRSDIADLREAASMARESGADRIRFADSVGIGTPAAVRNLAASLPDELLNLCEFHAHDDLGMAVANALEALSSGFGGLSGTIAGIGERAGNLPWEVLAVADQIAGEGRTGLNARVMVEVAQELLEGLGEPVSPRRPILGTNCRTHESGIHAAAHLRNPSAFLPYDPREFGLPAARIVAGTTSGRTGLSDMLRESGIEPSAADWRKLLHAVRTESVRKKRPLDTGDVARLHRRLARKNV